ncbi:MAG: MCE family protein, partial [Rhodococcus sp. (in: high G+C Gram-positive bacteria)]
MTPLSRPLVRLAAFGVAGVMSAVVVVNTLSVPVRGDTRSQTAEFTAVDGLRSGNDVTLAGVRVGRVNEVRYATDGTHSTAVVHFSVADAVPVPADVTAAVRYGDMLGARYLALVLPENPTGSLVDGDHIPVERTTPPVDLTALVNGFKPLFDAVDPEQVTLLARSIVDAFQGEAATVDSLLRNVEAVTSGLANNEVVLTELVADLDSVLGTMNLHVDEVTRLITGLTDMSRTVADRNADV